MKMNQRYFNYKILLICIFMLIISVPMILSIWEHAGGKRFDVTLADNSGTTYEYPHFEIQAF